MKNMLISTGIEILIVLGTLVAVAVILVALLIAYVSDKACAAVALATFKKNNLRFLKQLREIGAPPFDVYMRRMDDDFWESHDHTKCTAQTCPIKQAEEYDRLIQECKEAGVPEWRVHLAA